MLIFRKLLFFCFIVSISLLFSGCGQDDPGPSPSWVTDDAFAASIFNDITQIAAQSVDGNLATYRTGSDYSTPGHCAVLTFDTLDPNNPDTVMVDFGTLTCLGHDGKKRKGKLIVIFTGPVRTKGTVITVSTDSFFSENYEVMGSKTLTHLGSSSANIFRYSVNIQDAKIIRNGKDTMQWTSSQTREWITGSGTPFWLDDVYSVTGSGSGRSFSGTDYTMTISESLRFQLNCKWITKGKAQFKQDKTVSTLDYGNGSCDSKATITTNGKNSLVSLK